MGEDDDGGKGADSGGVTLPDLPTLVALMAQRSGVSIGAYLTTRTRAHFLADVCAWQASFMMPIGVVAKAVGAMFGAADEGKAAGPDGKQRRGLPAWHPKAGSAGHVWDLDDPVQEGPAMGAMSKAMSGKTTAMDMANANERLRARQADEGGKRSTPRRVSRLRKKR